MFKKYEKQLILVGLAFTIVSALTTVVLTWVVFSYEQLYTRMEIWMFDCGMDAMGALVCAALYYGCMRQTAVGAEQFRTLIALVSDACLVLYLFYFTESVPEYRIFTFILAMCSKIIDLVMIFLFYRYVRLTLSFKGRLADWTDKVVPILLGFEVLVILSNIFYPTTFFINELGEYQDAATSATENIFLAVTALLATILIIRSENPRNQKIAASAFIFLPLINYITLGGAFGNASQYSFVLMSLIIIFCIIFNDKSNKLASTQTELNMATEIQAGMLPSIFPAFPRRDEFDIYASMNPAKEVGGDFYDFFMIDDDHLGIVIADVSGKGVPAALFMMIAKTVVQNYAMFGISASEVLRRANDALCAQNKSQMFVTTWIGILEISTGKMNCASAGHEYPAICHAGKFELLEDEHGFVLGAMDGTEYEDYEIVLDKGDKIFVYTDGVPEANNIEEELFGTDRMIEALNTNVMASPQEVINIVHEAVDKYVGTAEQFDDLTMVCLEYRGKK